MKSAGRTPNVEDRRKEIEREARRRTGRYRSGMMLGGRAVDVSEVGAMSRRYEADARLTCMADDVAAALCEDCEVPRVLRFWYVSFAREVYGLWRRHWPRVYEAELPAVMFKWERRGLSKGMLAMVEQAVVAALQEDVDRGD
jgi:hypothetical protein